MRFRHERRLRHEGSLVVDRRRVELVEEEWAKQPYHAAEDLKPEKARDLVERGIESARRITVREVRSAVGREQGRGNKARAWGVLVGAPMPDWSVAEILAVHFRMHKAEGALGTSASGVGRVTASTWNPEAPSCTRRSSLPR